MLVRTTKNAGIRRASPPTEIVTIDGDSYRLREAEERQRERAAARKRKKEDPKG